MSTITKYIKSVLGVFAKITTWTLLSAACFISIFVGKEMVLDVMLLWQILGLSFLCAAGSVLFFLNAESVTRRNMLIRFSLCYLFINAVIMAGGLIFGWFLLSNWKMVLAMFVLVAAGYGVIVLVSYKLSEREAALMNEMLKKRE